MNIIEAIIEFIVGNIAFVILIGAGLFSFFKRLNHAEETKRTKPRKRVDEKPKQTASPFGTPVKSEVYDIDDSYDRSRKKPQEDAKRNHLSRQKTTERNAVRYQDKEDEIVHAIRADQKELQKAIIWSEVLAKPKAMQKRR
jgi:hypothetical protein